MRKLHTCWKNASALHRKKNEWGYLVMVAKLENKAKGKERHILGSLLGFALLAAICYWHYITVQDYYIENTTLPIAISTVSVTAAAVLWGFFGIGALGFTALWYPYQLAFGAAFAHWLCYNLSNPVPAWCTALSWLGGAFFSMFTLWTTAQASISDGLLRRLYVTAVLWSTLGFYGYTFLQVRVYWTNELAGLSIGHILFNVPFILIVVAAGLGTLYLMVTSSRAIQQYFVCYFHLMHGPRIQLANGKSCRVPLRFDNAYYAACSYKDGKRRGKNRFIAMSIYCVDVLKKAYDEYSLWPADWEIKEMRKNRKYCFPDAGGWLSKETVAGAMQNAIRAMKLQGDLVKAKGYAKLWVDLYWLGRKNEAASVADFYEIFKTWDEIDDGQSADIQWLEKTRKHLKCIKKIEAEENEKREVAARKQRMEQEAARIQEAREEMHRQRQSAKREQLRREYEEKRAGLDRAERALNFALDDRLFTNQENYIAGNLSADEYAMRDFVRDDIERKYREEYDDALARLEAEDDEDE